MISLKLNKREKRLAIAMIVVAVISGLYFFVADPLIQYYSSTEDKTESFSSKTDKMSDIYSKYLTIKAEREKFSKLLGKGGDNVTSMVPTFAANNSIEKNIAYTKATQTNVQNKYVKITTDVKIDGVPIQSLIKFINDLESSENLLTISYININKGLKGTDKYDALLKIISFTNK